MLFNFFLNLRIRFKLLIAFGSILLLSVIFIIITIYSIHSILERHQLNSEIDELSLKVLQLDVFSKEFINQGCKEKGFLTKQESKYITKFDQVYEKISQRLGELKLNEVIGSEFTRAKVQTVEFNLNTIRSKFKKLLLAYQERGFKDYGIEGDLRQAIHEVENSDYDYDKATMLMLRRHEKDFFLRKDIKYLEKFNQDIGDFEATLRARAESPLRNAVLENLKNYKVKFNYIVALEKKIGLSPEDGLKGSLNEAFNTIFPQINELVALIKTKNEQLIQNSIVVLIGIFVLQLLIGLFLIVFYSSRLTRSIKKLKNNLISLSEGTFPKKLHVRSKDEIAQTKKALNNLVERIRTATNFAQKLGNNELYQEYDTRFTHDVLGKTIVALQKKLILNDKEQEKVNWTNKGIALFNEILKNEFENLRELGDKIIHKLVEYLEVNQAAIFLLQEEDNNGKPYLERIATYAYKRKKFVQQHLSLDDNLVGQIALEKRTLYLKDVPEDYTKITSGLGESTPRTILIVPLKVRQDVVGVIELASFEILEEYQVNFVEKLSESLANVLHNKFRNEKDQMLLKELKQKTDALIAQEEELRQNAEELKTTQEELMRQRASMKEELQHLKNQNGMSKTTRLN